MASAIRVGMSLQIGRSPTDAPGVPTRLGLRATLRRLIWMCMLPMVLLAAYLAYEAATFLLGAVLFNERWRKPREVKGPRQTG